MPKSKSFTVNGVSIDIELWKAKSEKEFVAHEKHNFESEAKARESWKLFLEFLNPKKAD